MPMKNSDNKTQTRCIYRTSTVVLHEKSIFTYIMRRLHSIKRRHLTFCSEGRRNVNPAELTLHPYWTDIEG